MTRQPQPTKPHNGAELTHEEVAKQLGISVAWSIELERRALNKMFMAMQIFAHKREMTVEQWLSK